jgi:hypothetical protein
MQSSGMLRRVAVARTDVSEERSASTIRVTRIDELGITLAVGSNRRTLRRNICEDLKYQILNCWVYGLINPVISTLLLP